MHSTIERRLKNFNINVPADYVSISNTARQEPAPYQVNYIDHTFFKNYSHPNLTYISVRPGTKAGDLTVTDIVCFCYKPDGTLLYKLNFNDQWTILPCRRLTREKVSEISADSEVEAPLYSDNFP